MKPKKLINYAGGIITECTESDFGSASFCLPERWRVKATSWSDAARQVAKLAFLNEKRACQVWVMPVSGNDDPAIAVCSGNPSAGFEGVGRN